MKTADARSVLAEVNARPPGPEDPRIDGLSPSLILQPETVETAARALALCHEEGLAVVPLGGGTRLHVGNTPERLDCYISTAALRGIAHYEPGDLTLTAWSGTPLAELQAAAAVNSQFLPWDPPQPEKATVGGILALGDAGFRRRPGARPRDLLLGCEALLADGTAFKAGGRVVKNVAGYEVTKLLVGSLGTLAFLTRAHLRLRSRPESKLTLVSTGVSQEGAVDAVSRLRRAGIDPEVTAVVNSTVAAGLGLEGWTVLLRFEGFDEEVRALAAQTKDGFTGIDGAETFECRDVESERMWETLRDFPIVHDTRGIVARLLGLPSGVLSAPFEAADAVCIYPDGGLVYLKAEEPERYHRLVTMAGENGLRVVLESASPDLKREVDVFGEPPSGLSLMKRVKETLDPKGVFSPGRGVGKALSL